MNEEYYKELSAIGNRVTYDIINLLKERNVDSINVYAYTDEGLVLGYTFYDCDDNGYGVGLTIDSIEVINGVPYFNMVNEDCDGWGQKELADFDTTEKVYILEMLEELFSEVDDGSPLLAKDEEFDYEED